GQGARMVRPLAEAGLLDRDRKLVRAPRRRHRIHDQASADGGLSCRIASPAAIAAVSARLRLLAPGTSGTSSRESARAWTASGTPADSRPNSSTSPSAKANRV